MDNTHNIVSLSLDEVVTILDVLDKVERSASIGDIYKKLDNARGELIIPVDCELGEQTGIDVCCACCFKVCPERCSKTKNILEGRL